MVLLYGMMMCLLQRQNEKSCDEHQPRGDWLKGTKFLNFEKGKVEREEVLLLSELSSLLR